MFDNRKWGKYKEDFGIHAYGLNTQEINLLSILGKNAPVSLNGLAVKMGVNVQNIESELEVRPRELGFIENTTKGRFLTDEGKTYLKKIANNA